MGSGGVLCGISPDGRLSKDAFYKPGYGGRVSVHETSGVHFADFVIPKYKEALDICLKAHKCFYGVKTIGWDIAITDDGPVFIEGNDNWEISPAQCVNGGLKNQWVKV